MPRSSPYQVIDAGQKLCSKCDLWLPVDQFNKAPNKITGLAAHCKPCHRLMPSQRGERRRATSKASYYRTGRGLMKRYGLTVADYDQMTAAQGGRCAICGNPETRVMRGSVSPLAVDHDHATGAVRGLLCHACNAALGLFGDSPGLLRAAAEYLEKNNHDDN